jgi:chemotaxis protein MotB
MSGQTNVAPIIIKRKKVVSGDGHHGGAWKVAYADFVTAMMAFFMMMWLLNATTEQQRRGLADYFAPTIPVNRISGGGDGVFAGDSVFAEDTLAQNGTGATNLNPTEANAARGTMGEDQNAADAEQQILEEVQEALAALSGESMVEDAWKRHVITRITDEGLVIEIFDLQDAPLFLGETSEPAPILLALTSMLVRATSIVANDIAINAFVRTEPVVRTENPVWPLSVARAERMRTLLSAAGLSADRLRRVTGHADRQPAVRNPMDVRNNRLEITLLRR